MQYFCGAGKSTNIHILTDAFVQVRVRDEGQMLPGAAGVKGLAQEYNWITLPATGSEPATL